MNDTLLVRGGRVRVKKIALFIILTIIIALFVISHGKSKSDVISNQPSDLSQYQWYLKKDSYLEIKNANDEASSADGFSFGSSIIIENELDLGLDYTYSATINSPNDQLIVALIDTSIDIFHEDLVDNIWVNKGEVPNDQIDNDKNGYVDDYYGWNFINDSPSVDYNIDLFSHGTHCAGIIVAMNNDIGINGIAGNSNTQLMALAAVEEGDDKREIGQVISAIEYAEQMGAKICNLSCAFDLESAELEKTISSSSMLFIVSAGNYESNLIQGLDIDTYRRYPASYNYKNVVTVASVDCFGNRSQNSNYGCDTIDVYAPGEYIYSTMPNNTYGYLSGTSTSAPIVTGIISLYYSAQNKEVENIIEIVLDNAYEKQGNLIIRYD